MHERLFRLDRERIAKQVIWQSRLVLDVRRHDPLVAFREHLGHPSAERGVLSAREGEGGGARAERVRGSDRYDRLRQALGDVPHHTLVAGAGSVDLVHEHERRNAQPLQGTHQDAGLRLHALDGRDHEDRAVEHAQHTFHLRNEVGMAGRVDQVDLHVLQRERRDGRPDRDAALPLQRERVGLRRAGIDAAELVDGAGGIQQPLGESCLTGVYMRQDPQVQRSLQQASYPPNKSKSPSRWT